MPIAANIIVFWMFNMPAICNRLLDMSACAYTHCALSAEVVVAYIRSKYECIKKVHEIFDWNEKHFGGCMCNRMAVSVAVVNLNIVQLCMGP